MKESWFGTYYHGTSPASEKAILREGLKANKGGSGAARAFSEIAVLPEMANKFNKETAGKVSLSRSKLLSKIYGGMLTPDGPGLFESADRGAPGMKDYAKRKIKSIAAHQPFEVSKLKNVPLVRDPSHLLLGVQTTHDVPTKMLRKSKPNIIGRNVINILKRLL